MKTYLRKVRKLIPLCALSLLASCGIVDLEHSENGKLDGYWHLISVDTISTGGVCDLHQERRFWLVQGTIFQLYSPDLEKGQRYVSHFIYDEEKLIIEKLYKDKREDGDPELEDAEVLRPFGINQIESATFKIEELSSGSMMLSDENLRLLFKKQ
ncbi:MAG: lipocalin-like domain-containing protein [Prevotella sp.]|nr:lipocalin-like domain-containing protein [Prevotella sp.]